MGTVIVGMDGSAASHAAFEVALQQAEWGQHTLKAVHVFPYPVATVYQSMRADVADLESSAEEWLDGELAELEDQHGGSFPVPVEPVVEMGHAGSLLVEAAEGAELLVVGSRGYGGVRGLLLGSVSTFCAHHLECPLLIVPSPEEAADE